MKFPLLILFLAFMAATAIADEPSMPALKAIEKYGGITISDGSSFFTFSKDQSFKSGPVGLSGREFEGRWTADDLKFTVTAKMGWINGISSNHEYRRIVFVIYQVQKRPPEAMPPWAASSPNLCDGYFLIDELVRIPEPVNPPSR